MARKRRSTYAGTIYHLIARFVGQEWLIESEVERRAYLLELGVALPTTDWRCFAFAVMSNHIHLGLLAGTDPLVSWLRPMHNSFANWLNERRERIGAVFVRGPNMIDVVPGGSARLISYIHCNPVRARVVDAPSQSDWTSHRAYVGYAHRPSWLDIDLGLELAGFRDGVSLDRWMKETPTERGDLEAMHVGGPPRRGRIPARGPTPFPACGDKAA